MASVSGEKLTERQRDVLLWFAEYQLKNYCPPTLREVGDAFGSTTTNGPVSMLRPLVKKGWLSFTPKIARGYRLADWLIARPKTVLSVVAGSAAAV